MGRFKNESVSSPVQEWLEKQGYKQGRGAQGEEGLVKVYSVYAGFYYVYVTFNLEECKIYVYKDLNCGGYEGSAEYDIEKDWLDKLELFVDEVDKLLESWIG